MEKLYELFRSFINDIIKVFPEYEERLHETYEDLFLDDGLPDNYLNDFLKKINKYNDKISEKDESFFLKDPIIIPNLSFKMMWISNISKDTRKKIWKYLISFSMMEIQLRCNDKITDVLKLIESNEKVKDKETVEDMKKLKKLNELLSNDNDNSNDNVEDIMPEGMNGILENTNIGQIAQEITQELDIENMVGDGGIESLLSGDNMMNIFKTINDKIENKVGGDDNAKNNLMGEAGNICDTMKDNPLFSTLMQGMDGMMNQGGQPPPQDVKNINFQDKSYNPNATRSRLQKKLKEKKEKKVNVEKLNN